MTNLAPKLQVATVIPKLLTVLRGFSLLRTAAGTLGLKIAATGLAFLNGILLARLLGPAEFGVYAIALSAVNFAATLAVLGLPMFATREAAALAEHRHWGRLKGLLRAAHRSTLLAVLAILGISVALLAGDIVKPTVSWLGIAIAMALVPLTALNQLRAAILRGLHWVILADIPDLLLRPLVMLLLLAGAARYTFVTSSQISAVDALGMQLGAIVLALLVGTWWLTTRRPAPLKTATPEPPPKAWLLTALPFLGIMVIATLEGQVSLYLVGYLGGAQQAGLFQAANQFACLIAIGLVAVNMPLQPKVAAAWARGDKQQAQRLVAEAARMGTGIALVGMLLILIFAEALLMLYGAQYVEAAHALRILAVGQMAKAVAGSGGVVLLMAGHQRAVLQGTILALLLNVAVGYLVIPRFGVAGGALAATLGMICWTVSHAVYAWKKIGINPSIFVRMPDDTAYNSAFRPMSSSPPVNHHPSPPPDFDCKGQKP